MKEKSQISLHVFHSYTEWQTWRKNKLGASEVGYILGLNPYVSAHEFWERKMREDEGGGGYAKSRGILKESCIAALFEQASGESVVKRTGGFYSYSNLSLPDYMIASPDRELFARGRRSRPLLECKDTTRIFDVLSVENCPPEWLAQMQMQMHVAGREICFLATEDGRKKLHWFPLLYSAAAAEEMVAYCAEWWEKYIVGRTEPPAESRDAMHLYPEADMGTLKNVSTDYLQIKEKIKRKKEVIKRLKKEVEMLTDELRLACGEAEIIEADGQPICRWSNQKRKAFDEQQFAEKHPQLYREFLNETTHRKLIIL